MLLKMSSGKMPDGADPRRALACALPRRASRSGVVAREALGPRRGAVDTLTFRRAREANMYLVTVIDGVRGGGAIRMEWTTP